MKQWFNVPDWNSHQLINLVGTILHNSGTLNMSISGDIMKNIIDVKNIIVSIIWQKLLTQLMIYGIQKAFGKFRLVRFNIIDIWKFYFLFFASFNSDFHYLLDSVFLFEVKNSFKSNSRSNYIQSLFVKIQILQPHDHRTAKKEVSCIPKE